MNPDVARVRDRVGKAAEALSLPVLVMFTSAPPQPAGGWSMWASAPTPRAAVAFVDRTNPARAAGQIVEAWCDAQQAVGRTVTESERARLVEAAELATKETA